MCFQPLTPRQHAIQWNIIKGTYLGWLWVWYLTIDELERLDTVECIRRDLEAENDLK